MMINGAVPFVFGHFLLLFLYRSLSLFYFRSLCLAEEGDVVERSGIVPGTSKMTCKFGDLTLKLLDTVSYVGGDKLNCKCYIPPMVHCMKSN